MTEQHELLENTASRVDKAPGTAAPADQPGFDIPPIEEDHGEPDKTVPVERNIETVPEIGGGPETDAAVENPTLKDVFGLVQRLSTQKAQEERDDGARLNAGTRKLLEIMRKLTAHADETRSLITELSAAGARQQEAGAALGRLEEAVRDYTADLHRAAGHERSRWTWPGLALAVAVPAFFLLGVLVEQQFAIIPLDDPTGGWRGYIWDNYGNQVADCARQATKTNRVVKCSFDVHRL